MSILRVGAIADVETEDEQRERLVRLVKRARESGSPGPRWSPAAIEREVVSRRIYVDVEVVEFVDLSDGRRIVGEERLGFTSGASGVQLGADLVARPDPWQGMTAEEIERSVALVVTADGSSGLSRWGSLLRTCAKRGLDITADQLDAAPFGVVFSERLKRRLDGVER